MCSGKLQLVWVLFVRGRTKEREIVRSAWKQSCREKKYVEENKTSLFILALGSTSIENSYNLLQNCYCGTFYINSKFNWYRKFYYIYNFITTSLIISIQAKYICFGRNFKDRKH